MEGDEKPKSNIRRNKTVASSISLLGCKSLARPKPLVKQDCDVLKKLLIQTRLDIAALWDVTVTLTRAYNELERRATALYSEQRACKVKAKQIRKRGYAATMSLRANQTFEALEQQSQNF